MEVYFTYVTFVTLAELVHNLSQVKFHFIKERKKALTCLTVL